MLALVIVALSCFLVIPLMSAAVAIQPVTVWTDKQKYAPGEKGTLYVAFYNTRDEPIDIKNITVVYDEWVAYIENTGWVGNETKKFTEPLSSKATRVFKDITFTVPTDGRGTSTHVSVEIGTNKGYVDGSGYVSVPDTPRSMDQIVSLFTIQVVLIIVATIIVAATIFLSARRPQMLWKSEGKE
jgi:hypothetical protein